MQALVVDDSSAMRAFLKLILKRMGFEVREARNGKEGLAALEATGAPELLLLDWNMPEMDGFEMLRRVRADGRWSGVKVVMVTTETEIAEVSRALGAGADEYVMKPFTPEILVDKLELLGLGQAAV